jgi:hypothetical protein
VSALGGGVSSDLFFFQREDSEKGRNRAQQNVKAKHQRPVNGTRTKLYVICSAAKEVREQ